MTSVFLHTVMPAGSPLLPAGTPPAFPRVGTKSGKNPCLAHFAPFPQARKGRRTNRLVPLKRDPIMKTHTTLIAVAALLTVAVVVTKSCRSLLSGWSGS